MASAVRTPAARPPPRRQTHHQEAPSKQVSEVGHRGTLLSLTSVCAPGEGQSGAGCRAGTRTLERGPPATGTGAPGGRARAARWQPRLAGRTTAPLGSSACPPARVSSAVSRRVQPSSPAARAAAGGLSQHLPAVSHTPLRDTGGSGGRLCPHTRARLPPHAPFGAKNQNSKTKKMRGSESEAGGGAPTREVSWQRRGVGGDGGGNEPGESEAKSVSLSGEARSARAGPASGARAAPAAWGTTLPPALPHKSGLLA